MQKDTGNNSLDPDSLRKNLPGNPGVYLFKDNTGNIIYVGKAKNLKNRVMSYFISYSDLSIKTSLMMKKAKDIEFILTSTENEAFILERNLIKKHMPRYNVVLRDDKNFPCLRLSIKDAYPRLNIVRKIRKDGALYFGPFSSANSVRSTLRLIDRIFRLRKCKNRGLPKRSRPCLNYQLGRCLGPCSNSVSRSEYMEIITQVRLFLEGRNKELIAELKAEMHNASESMRFEDAARIRDQIRSVEKTIERQHVVSPKLEDMDVIGLARKNGAFSLAVLFIRKGYMQGSRNFFFKDQNSIPAEVMEAFIKQFYGDNSFIPKQIIISEPIDDLRSIKTWISDLAGKKISIHHPIKGEKLRLVRIALTNAENSPVGSMETSKEAFMERIKSVLKLQKMPHYIEGLDISNIYGNIPVGSIVSFLNGSPNKSGYRNYRIKHVQDIDDYGMMNELITRRLEKGDLPDLFLVDGGKGHLMVVKNVIDAANIEVKPEIISIAKAHDGDPDKTDKIYLPNRKNPLSLRNNDPVLLLMMHIRDEAHRRAIGYHRKLRTKNMKESSLDHIKGIGPRLKMLLLEKFGDIDHISKAASEELENIQGIGQGLAQNITDYFKHSNLKHSNFKQNNLLKN